MTATGNSTPTRLCKGCKQELPATLEVFPPHKLGKYGLFTHCRPCKKEQDAKRRERPDQKARQQAWRNANKEKIKETNAAYRAAGYKSTEHVRLWAEKNPDRAKELDRNKVRRWRATVPWYNLKTRVSSRINSMLKAGGGDKARRSTQKILGYSIDELARHIERQFTAGMNWDKFLAGEIHIDHIIPVSRFRAESVDSPEFKACWALSNLRPMWAADNRSKGDKITSLL